MAELRSSSTHLFLHKDDVADATIHHLDDRVVIEIPGLHDVTIEGDEDVVREWLAELYVAVRNPHRRPTSAEIAEMRAKVS